MHWPDRLNSHMFASVEPSSPNESVDGRRTGWLVFTVAVCIAAFSELLGLRALATAMAAVGLATLLVVWRKPDVFSRLPWPGERKTPASFDAPLTAVAEGVPVPVAAAEAVLSDRATRHRWFRILGRSWSVVTLALWIVGLTGWLSVGEDGNAVGPYLKAFAFAWPWLGVFLLIGWYRSKPSSSS